MSLLSVLLQATTAPPADDGPAAPAFFGFMGCTAALVFACARPAAPALRAAAVAGFGAAYGTAKSGVGVAAMGVMRPELVMRNIIPVVMAGVIGIYGLIIAVIVASLGTALLPA